MLWYVKNLLLICAQWLILYHGNFAMRFTLANWIKENNSLKFRLIMCCSLKMG